MGFLMLLSLSRRYVFLASGKAASSSFEAALGPECEIASSNNRRAGLHPLLGTSGKHMSYRAFTTVFGRFLRRFLPIEHYFIFGVAREPLRRMESMYRYFSRPEAGPNTALNRGTSWPRFLEERIEAHAAGEQIGQHRFFCDERGALSLNYLVRFEEIGASLEHLLEATGLDFRSVAARHVNANPHDPEILVDPGLRRAFETEFALDHELYESSCDRLLHPWDSSGDLDVENALRWLALKANRFEIAATLFAKLAARLEAEPGFAVSEILDALDARDALTPARSDPRG